jgi:coproporphyrinogen III oxidase-like Fe-S oxidoreductase
VPLRDVIESAETYELAHIRQEAMTAIEELKTKGPQSSRNFAWWGQAGQTVFALGCVAAGVMGQVYMGVPCVVGGALSNVALKYLAPAQP